MTETINSLVMITKAGVPSSKVVVGVTSYARVFQMADPNCYTPMCKFTGPGSGATPGSCTNTAGYISDAEIKKIAQTRANKLYYDAASQSDILICKFVHSHLPNSTGSEPSAHSCNSAFHDTPSRSHCIHLGISYSLFLPTDRFL